MYRSWKVDGEKHEFYLKSEDVTYMVDNKRNEFIKVIDNSFFTNYQQNMLANLQDNDFVVE